MKQLTVNAQISYKIKFIQDLLTSDLLPNDCKNMASQIIIISDDTVAAYYGEKIKDQLEKANLPVHLLTFPPGEHYKTRETKSMLEDGLFKNHCTRDTLIVALGGGIVTDVAGFIAATYCRGVPVIYIPTTLLAMVDASIGGKTGVNTPWGKNMIGTFTQPSCVYIDVNFLDTLPFDEFNNGIVELIKHALIYDKNLFLELEKNKISLNDKNYLQEKIYESCEIKKAIVEKDPEEKNIRQLLNFGHTVGHVIEAASDYEIKHGYAVAMGMVLECQIAEEMGILNPSIRQRMVNVLQMYDIPLKLPENLQQEDLMHFFKMDKKTHKQQIRSVLLEDIGKPYTANAQYAHTIDNDLLQRCMKNY